MRSSSPAWFITTVPAISATFRSGSPKLRASVELTTGTASGTIRLEGSCDEATSKWVTIASWTASGDGGVVDAYPHMRFNVTAIGYSSGDGIKCSWAPSN